MRIEDKSLLLAFLALPRLGLSQAQIAAIERVIDRQPVCAERAYVAYADAMAALGFTTVAGVRKLAKEGHLELFRLPGRTQAVGVTRASLERCLAARKHDD